MKKFAALLLVGILLLGGVVVLATGGSSTDPLVSLSYLTGTFLTEINTAVETQIDTTTQTTYQGILDGMDSLQSDYIEQATELGGGEIALTDRRVKANDVITLDIGSSMMLLAGSATVTTSTGGVVVDVSSGQTMTSGGSLVAMHHYIVGEGGAVALSITSDTAVIALSGTSQYISSTQTDYNAIADALKEMGMFKGGDVAYGSGYELERAPTRIEALIMFLRMLGEENAALAYTGTCPFVDAPAWCESYLAYAYDMGYTKGIGTNTAGELVFGVQTTSTAKEYVTFILRALGYTDSGDSPDFTWDTVEVKGLEAGIWTATENLYFTNDEFLRAHVAYLSYFTLTTPVKGSSSTLLDTLSAKGSVNATSIKAIMTSAAIQRMQ